MKRVVLPCLLSALLLSACDGPAPRNTVSDPQLQQQAQAFEVCAYCHTIGAGQKHKVGPNLYNVYGREAAQADGYGYSTALRESDLRWDAATLDTFLRNPPTLVPGTHMVNATVDPQRRAAVIAYLKHHSEAAAKAD